MSSASSIEESASKITWALGCDHQLPTIGSPAIASATLGTGPFADASTTPFCSTNFDHFGFADAVGFATRDFARFGAAFAFAFALAFVFVFCAAFDFAFDFFAGFDFAGARLDAAPRRAEVALGDFLERLVGLFTAG